MFMFRLSTIYITIENHEILPIQIGIIFSEVLDSILSLLETFICNVYGPNYDGGLLSL